MIPQRLIDEYNVLYRPIHDFELSQYDKKKLDECVRGFRVKDFQGRIITSVSQLKKGMIAVPNNEHQFRTPVATKTQLENKLRLNGLNIYANVTFEELYEDLGKLLGPMTDLLHYDIALRIGAAYGIKPKDWIYLHAGALKGAFAVKKHYHQDLDIKTTIDFSSFVNVVPELSKFTAFDIEHFFCIYKSQL